VEVSREDLTQHFESLPDEELLQRLRSGTLTPLAIQVAGDILRSRGIDPLPFTDAGDSTVDPVVGLDGKDLDLVTVSVEWDPLKASLLRALLESHGIFAYVWGEHLATAHLFLSNAGGGSRLQVRRDQVSQASELISAFERGELEAPDLPDEDAATEQTTPSRPYTFPSNPYIPSPAAIDARATDRPSAPPPRDKSVEASPELPPHPRTDKRARTSSSPLRKIAFLTVGTAAALALWLMFTH